MRRFFGLVALAALVFVAIGFAGAWQSPRVVRYRVAVAGLAAPVKLVQLSDTHVNWLTMPPSRLADIVAEANALNPDIVVLTGDYHASHLWNWPTLRLEKALYPFGKLRARLGVFAVLGNHDDPYWTPRVMARTPVRLLVADWGDAGPIILAGPESLGMPPDARGHLRAAIERAPPGKPVIVIAHEPGFFSDLPARAQLMIAGHTHGGQVRLPGVGAYPSPYDRAHPRGLFREHGQTLIVSSGLGTSILPLRIGVRPEIVEIELVP